MKKRIEGWRKDREFEKVVGIQVFPFHSLVLINFLTKMPYQEVKEKSGKMKVKRNLSPGPVKVSDLLSITILGQQNEVHCFIVYRPVFDSPLLIVGQNLERPWKCLYTMFFLVFLSFDHAE